MFLATLALPPYLRARGRRRARSTATMPDAAPLYEALATLSEGIAAWQHASEQLREENQVLRDRLASLHPLAEASGEPAPATTDALVPTVDRRSRAEPPP